MKTADLQNFLLDRDLTPYTNNWGSVIDQADELMTEELRMLIALLQLSLDEKDFQGMESDEPDEP